MKKILILSFVLVLSYSVEAQNIATNLDTLNCGFFHKETAIYDVKNKKIQLLLKSGIAPKMYDNQDAFCKKYSVKYIELGCMGDSKACLRQYNRVMANYLDKKFGKKWRKDVREDVLF